VNAVPRPSTSAGFVEGYAAAVERFAVAVGWSDLRAPVAACPGWSGYDLVVHLGNVHAWAATIVETGRRAAEHNDEPRSRRSRAVSEWYFAKAEDLYQVLRSTPPGTPCWNFAFGDGVAEFWQRRQLHETTVHQVDLDAVAGRTTAVSAWVAADGVDEVLTVLVARMVARGHSPGLVAPLQLTASDTGDSWVVTPQPRSGVPQQSPRPGTVAEPPQPPPPPTVERRVGAGADPKVPDRLEAPADVLYRALWHRRFDEGALRLTGDESRVRAFLGSRLTP
jgi:uncharacterized protein (TIGR03083 family)